MMSGCVLACRGAYPPIDYLQAMYWLRSLSLACSGAPIMSLLSGLVTGGGVEPPSWHHPALPCMPLHLPASLQFIIHNAQSIIASHSGTAQPDYALCIMHYELQKLLVLLQPLVALPPAHIQPAQPISRRESHCLPCKEHRHVGHVSREYPHRRHQSQHRQRGDAHHRFHCFHIFHIFHCSFLILNS